MNNIQYLVLLLAVLGSFLVTSKKSRVRCYAFVLYIFADVLAIVWAAYRGDAVGVIITQVLFIVAAVRGVIVNWRDDG